VVVPLPVEVHTPGSDDVLHTHTIDISPDGVLLACVGTPDEVELVLDLRTIGRIRTTARVARRAGGRTAFELTGLTKVRRRELERALRRPVYAAA
jgi:hypothetical protein